MERQSYPCDLTTGHWLLLKLLWPAPQADGRPARVSRREIINAIRYVVRTGCAWHILRHDFPHWGLVHHYFRLWHLQGV